MYIYPSKWTLPQMRAMILQNKICDNETIFLNIDWADH